MLKVEKSGISKRSSRFFNLDFRRPRSSENLAPAVNRQPGFRRRPRRACDGLELMFALSVPASMRRANKKMKNPCPVGPPGVGYSCSPFIFPNSIIPAHCEDYAPHGNPLAEKIPESKDCEPLASYSALTPKNFALEMLSWTGEA